MDPVRETMRKTINVLWVLGLAATLGAGVCACGEDPGGRRSQARGSDGPAGAFAQADPQDARRRRSRRPMAPPHKRPIIQRGGKSLLWALGDPKSDEAQWFDVTDALVDPEKFQYGIGKDKIPAIDNPEFVKPDDPRLARMGINDGTEVIGYAHGGEARAYPIFIMARHELVNDTVGGKPVTVGW